MFHEKVKALRLEKRLTLRDFCQQVKLDPSNWSKVERGINPPPGDVAILEKLADFFEMNDADKLELMDAAAIDRNELPKDIADNDMLANALPAFFRAARGHELTDEKLTELIEDIRKLNRPDQ